MLSLPNPILSSALARPEHIVLRADGRAITAQALLAAVRRRAHQLSGLGVVAGDTVAVWGHADVAFVVNLHALGWLGAAAAPLAVRAPDAERQRHLAALGCCRLVLGPGADAATRAGLARALGPAGDILADLDGCATDCLEALHADPDGSQPPERFWPADEVRLVVLSSGTSAAPHVVRLSAAQLFFSAAGSATRLGHHVDDIWLLCLPLHHVGGLSILFRAAFFGAAVTLMPHFDAAAVAAALAAEGSVSLVSLVPQMLQRVLEAADRAEGPWAPSATLRAIVLGGAPAPESLLTRCRARRLPICVSWGMTESASQVATTWPGDFAGRGDCGPPLPFARVTRAAAVPGPLVVHGPVVANMPVTTSDYGQITASGRVLVQGRCDDILISGGENIAPFEVESVLLEHPAIADAAVIGVGDTTWGQRPVAVLVPAAGSRPTQEALVAWCRDRLAAFKVPAQFVWCQSLPRNALGKLQRQRVHNALHQGVEHV